MAVTCDVCEVKGDYVFRGKKLGPHWARLSLPHSSRDSRPDKCRPFLKNSGGNTQRPECLN